MSNHTSTRFDEGLRNLQNMMMEMSKLTEKQLTNINLFLQKAVTEEALAEVQQIDNKVNLYHVDINKDAVSLIATRAPVASDLRLISSIDRIATDLERIGDEVCKIARFMASDEVDTNDKLWRELRSTMRLAQASMSQTLDMLARFDVDAAHRIIKEDSYLDDNYTNIMRQLISFMMEDPRNIKQSVDIMFAAKALERVGDHCNNIAEAVIFYELGEDVRIDGIQ